MEFNTLSSLSRAGLDIGSRNIDVSAIPEPEVLRIDDKKGLWKKRDKIIMEEWKREQICKKCSAAFDSYKALVKHQSSVHDKLNCSHCGAHFRATMVLHAHLRNHRDKLSQLYPAQSNHETVKKHLCHHCGELFRPNTFRGHLRTHTGDRPFVCAFCAKTFASTTALHTHENTHIGVKPYKCDTCSARFSNKSKLITHLMIHTGEKPYECTRCDAKFNQEGNLRAHMRRHTGEKPFKCDQCGACFTWNVCLKTHRKNCRSK